MNLVKQITDQLTAGALSQLGSLLGTDVETTDRAASAAVPSLLSALAGLASKDDGAKKLTSTLAGLDTSSLGNITQMLGGASSLLGKGNSLLGSLFGDSVISGLANSLSRITGVNSGIIKNLLGYLMPLVLSKVATQWKNQGGTANALQNLFAEQRGNIEAALPAGLSLADIPNTGEVRSPAYTTTRRTVVEPAATKSPFAWLIPAALALLAGFFLWQFLTRPRVNQVATERPVQSSQEVRVMKPTIPDSVDASNLADVRTNLGDLFKSLDTSFGNITDAASAERAIPALEDLNRRIDSADEVLARLPAASTTTLRPMLEDQVKAVAEKAIAAGSIAGISTQFKSLIQTIVDKLAKWVPGGLGAAQAALLGQVDGPNLTAVRDSLGGLFKSIDTTFADIHDAASAERAMPALQELNAKIDAAGQVVSRLPAAGAATLRPMLEEQIQAAVNQAKAASSIDGVSAQFKSLVQMIVDKISSWTSAETR